VSDLVPVPGQTIGPFFGFALPYPGGSELVPPGSPGSVALRGRVLDGADHPVPDALVEIWQRGPDGGIPQEAGTLHRDGWSFTGWGRAATDRAGKYSFSTLAPGAPEGGGPAFFAITVLARGLTNRLFTRAYLPGEPAVLDRDPLLSALPEQRRRTLLAQRAGGALLFDIRLQGERETVFLRYPAHPDR
jgi:protocatechuate 3,4-dioxygenase, alpha subunit